MKWCTAGVEVTYRFWNNRDKYTRVQPCPAGAWCFFNFYIFSFVIIHNNMTLKHLIWWKDFEFFSPEIKKKLWNGHWKVPAIQQHSVGLNAHWKVAEQCLKPGFQWTFRERSVGTQKCFSWLKGEFSSCISYLLCINEYWNQ